MKVSGFLVLDKPSGITSHDLVGRVRRIFNTKKVGHAGTLDPMATGVMVIGLGDATRLLPYITEGRKEYEATIRLGFTTVTDDHEGEILAHADERKLSEISDQEISERLTMMQGKILQRPSAVSAIKIGGRRAHERVRSGEKVEIPPREVEIESITINSMTTGEFRDISITVICSAGTYIRAIARDLGEVLGVGGHLISLRRTRVEPFSIGEASALEDKRVIPIADALSRVMPIRKVSDDEAREISFGRPLSLNSTQGVCAAVNSHGEFLALLENGNVLGRDVASPIMVVVRE
jgi:tRNA pseudouridine55 synthase